MDGEEERRVELGGRVTWSRIEGWSSTGSLSTMLRVGLMVSVPEAAASPKPTLRLRYLGFNRTSYSWPLSAINRTFSSSVKIFHTH